MRLDKTDLNYSRTAGMFVLEQGNSTWTETSLVSDYLNMVKGIESVEGCEDEGWITLVYSKQWVDYDDVKVEYKEAKRKAKLVTRGELSFIKRR